MLSDTLGNAIISEQYYGRAVTGELYFDRIFLISVIFLIRTMIHLKTRAVCPTIVFLDSIGSCTEIFVN